jgi:hypothetical protein
MGYIIAYLLLALVIDLIRELVNPEGDHRNTVAIHRRLWSDTLFDCRTKVFSVEGNTVRQPARNTLRQSRGPCQKLRPWFARVCKMHG